MGDKKKYKVIDQAKLVRMFKDIKRISSSERCICSRISSGIQDRRFVL